MTPALLPSVLRHDFYAFAQKGFSVLNPGIPFQGNWHIAGMAESLRQMRAGGHARQIITMPPRSLKSIMVSVAWPAFLLGLNPAERIVAVSYSETLAEKLSNDTRRLMESPFYRNIFPGTVLAKKTNLQLVTDQGGTRFATSVGGPTTGFGGSWIILDDPHNASEAYSVPARETVKRYFGQTLSSRLDDETTGKMLLVMQRLHEDDLAGHLLGLGGWRHLKLQAQSTEDSQVEVGPGQFHTVRTGDLLHPSRLPLAVLDHKKQQMGSLNYQAQYQQEPVPDGGNMIKREWLMYTPTSPQRGDGQVTLSLDTATKTGAANDYSACTVWLELDGRHHVVHVWREKVDFPALKRKVMDLMSVYQADNLLIEDQGAGTSLIQELRNVGAPAIARKARDTKEARLSAATSFIEAGLMVQPEDGLWRAEFETELLGFPAAKHDDQVDTVSQYFAWVRERTTGWFIYDMMKDDIEPEHDYIADRLSMRQWR